MKTVSAIFILVIAASIGHAINPEEKKAHIMKIFGDCKASVGASDDDMTRIMMHTKPVTHEGMCLFSCILEHMGIMKDGKLNKEGIQAWEKAMDAPPVTETVMTDCGGISHADPCEAASEMGFCFKQTAKKLGYDF